MLDVESMATGFIGIWTWVFMDVESPSLRWAFNFLLLAWLVGVGVTRGDEGVSAGESTVKSITDSSSDDISVSSVRSITWNKKMIYKLYFLGR